LEGHRNNLTKPQMTQQKKEKRKKKTNGEQIRQAKSNKPLGMHRKLQDEITKWPKHPKTKPKHGSYRQPTIYM
jgi:hypothetical protein